MTPPAVLISWNFVAFIANETEVNLYFNDHVPFRLLSINLISKNTLLKHNMIGYTNENSPRSFFLNDLKIYRGTLSEDEIKKERLKQEGISFAILY